MVYVLGSASVDEATEVRRLRPDDWSESPTAGVKVWSVAGRDCEVPAQRQ